MAVIGVVEKFGLPQKDEKHRPVRNENEKRKKGKDHEQIDFELRPVEEFVRLDQLLVVFQFFYVLPYLVLIHQKIRFSIRIHFCGPVFFIKGENFGRDLLELDLELFFELLLFKITEHLQFISGAEFFVIRVETSPCIKFLEVQFFFCDGDTDFHKKLNRGFSISIRNPLQLILVRVNLNIGHEGLDLVTCSNIIPEFLANEVQILLLKRVAHLFLLQLTVKVVIAHERGQFPLNHHGGPGTVLGHALAVGAAERPALGGPF